jgi:hypothetical protein
MTAVAFGGLARLLFTDRVLWLKPVPRASYFALKNPGGG